MFIAVVVVVLSCTRFMSGVAQVLSYVICVYILKRFL